MTSPAWMPSAPTTVPSIRATTGTRPSTTKSPKSIMFSFDCVLKRKLSHVSTMNATTATA